MKLIREVTYIVFAMVMTGCITSRSPDFYGYRLQLDEGKQKKAIAYTLIRSGAASTHKSFDPMSSTPAFTGAWAGAQVEQVAVGQFRSIFEPAAKNISPSFDLRIGDADILMEINQQNTWNPLACIPAFFSGFTFGCIPCWGDDIYYLNAKVTSKTGRKKEYLIKREVSTVSWLPLIFAMPFGEMPVTAVNKITQENWKELRQKMEDDGFFDSQR